MSPLTFVTDSADKDTLFEQLNRMPLFREDKVQVGRVGEKGYKITVESDHLFSAAFISAELFGPNSVFQKKLGFREVIAMKQAETEAA